VFNNNANDKLQVDARVGDIMTMKVNVPAKVQALLIPTLGKEKSKTVEKWGTTWQPLVYMAPGKKCHYATTETAKDGDCLKPSNKDIDAVMLATKSKKVWFQCGKCDAFVSPFRKGTNEYIPFTTNVEADDKKWTMCSPSLDGVYDQSTGNVRHQGIDCYKSSVPGKPVCVHSSAAPTRTCTAMHPFTTTTTTTLTQVRARTHTCPPHANARPCLVTRNSDPAVL